MGTHNLLLRLGSALFLEVIAVDPMARRPERPRWFDLDRVTIEGRARLACWVARTDDLPAALDAASEPLGHAEPMSRGALQWLISIPQDGHLPMDGTAPALIQWQTPRHPAAHLLDAGCTLTALQLFHPDPARLDVLLRQLQVREPGVSLSVHPGATAAIVAHVDTPHGARRIGDPAPRAGR